MATGILGTPRDLAAAAPTILYTVPADTFAVFTVSIVNRGSSAATIRLAISDGGTPGNAEFIEFDASLSPKGVLERTGLVAQGNKNVIVQSSNIDVTAIAYGIETSTA